MSELDSTAALRAKLLAYCDEQCGEVRFRHDATGSSKRIAQGIRAARALVESTALDADPQRYLQALSDALEDEKERLRRDADDEDGWALGGVTTILNRIEMERAAALGAFEIVFEPATARAVSRYVARSFFGPRELPQAAVRMVLTREFWVFAGLPLVLLLAAQFVQALLPIAVLWLLAGLVRIARYGRARGIGCFVRNADGSRGARVGGLRMRLEKGARKLWIAGLMVEPHARGRGIGTALVLAAFKLALRESG